MEGNFLNFVIYHLNKHYTLKDISKINYFKVFICTEDSLGILMNTQLNQIFPNKEDENKNDFHH